MLKRFPAVLLLSLIFIAPAFADSTAAFYRVAKSKTINCGYIVAPPYITKDANSGKIGGINYDMMEAIGANLGLKINWAMEVPPGDVAAALNADKIDVMCQTMWPSASRYTVMTFANRPEFYSAIYAIVRADDTRFDGDLNKANVKSVRATGYEGDFSSDLVHEKLPNATFTAMPPMASISEYILQLTTKKSDILFMDKGSMEDFNAKSPHAVKAVGGLPAARTYGEHLTVKLGEFALRDMLDMATLQLVNDGAFDALVKRYAREYHTEIYASKSDIAR
jgi:ABC-type amino acid transport substrate-binding protein